MKRIIITGLLGVLVFGIALIGVAISDNESPLPSPGIVDGALVTGTASGPGKIATVRVRGVTARALDCTGTSRFTLVAGHGAAAVTASTIGTGSNGIPCADVGRELAIASGAPPSIVAQFSKP
jgi:hypothetical protein